MKAKFSTLKSAKRLVFGQLGLYRKMRTVRGWGYIREQLSRAEKLERILAGIMIAMDDWSRAHRREHGSKAVVDDYLIMHAGEIRFCLDELTALVDELETVELSAEQWAVLDDYKLSLHGAWRLDLLEDEAHQIARLAPKPPIARQVWQEPQEVEPITTDDIRSVARLLADTVQAKRTAEVAALFGPAIGRIVWN